MRARSVKIAAAAVACVALVGCGSERWAGKPRPAPPVSLTAAITRDGLAISPDRVGAGEVELLVSNQTGVSQTITIEGERDRVRSDKIAPGDAASVVATLSRGDYLVIASPGARGGSTARLAVGAPRRDSSDELLLP